MSGVEPQARLKMGTASKNESTFAAVTSIKKDLVNKRTLPGTLTVYFGVTEYVTLVLQTLSYNSAARKLAATVAAPGGREAATKDTRE